MSQRYYGVPYSHCGCNYPTELIILPSLAQIEQGEPYGASSPGSVSAPPTNQRPDLVASHDDEDDGIVTDPSEHNSVVVSHVPWNLKKQREKREGTRDSSLVKRAKAVEKDHTDYWTVLQDQRH